jgi:hypothetical protein
MTSLQRLLVFSIAGLLGLLLAGRGSLRSPPAPVTGAAIGAYRAGKGSSHAAPRRLPASRRTGPIEDRGGAEPDLVPDDELSPELQARLARGGVGGDGAAAGAVAAVAVD